MTFNKILKMINDNKVVVITLCLLVFISVFLYKKNEIFKLIGYEGFENKNLTEEVPPSTENGSETYYQKKESTTNTEASKYAFIKKGTCTSANKEPITNGDECKTAATALGWKDFKYNVITENFGKDRPKGCARHPFGNLDFFKQDKSSGNANVNGYSGIYCKLKVDDKNFLPFLIFKYSTTDNLFSKNYPQIKYMNTKIKTKKLKKWKSKIIRIGGGMVKKIKKLEKKIKNLGYRIEETSSDDKKEELKGKRKDKITQKELKQKRFEQLKSAADQITAIQNIL